MSFLVRTAAIYPERVAVVHGRQRRTYREVLQRSLRLASALERHGIRPGDTVAAMLPNIPAMLEAHHGVPMCGAILNALNTRLDAAALAFILQHGEAKALLTDTEFAPLMREAVRLASCKLMVIDVDDPEGPGGERIGSVEYEPLLAEGDPGYQPLFPADEWQAIALNYTSGTTGNPKGVVYHHRGAHLNALGNVLVWSMPQFPVYLWTLPMFHCNGWCFPWSIVLQAGTQVCLRRVASDTIFAALAEQGVTHLCGAPIVMGMLVNAPEAVRRPFPQKVRMMTAASAPPAAVLEKMEALGIEVTHVYGLTEVYGPATVCAWQEDWAALDADHRSRKLARQGVPYPVLEGLEVMDPATMTAVPRDGETIGEIMMRGHDVAKGYLKNPSATAEAFAGGWFHTGDLGRDARGRLHRDRTARRTSSSRAGRTSARSRSKALSTATPPCWRPRSSHDPTNNGASAPALRDPTRGCGRHGRGVDRALPPRARPVQGAADGGVRSAAQNLDRQDPEVPAARAGETACLMTDPAPLREDGPPPASREAHRRREGTIGKTPAVMGRARV